MKIRGMGRRIGIQIGDGEMMLMGQKNIKLCKKSTTGRCVCVWGEQRDSQLVSQLGFLIFLG